MRSFLTFLAAGLLAGGVAIGGAFAQSSSLNQAGQNTSDADLQAQIDAAFKQVLANPTDVNLSYRYAQLLMQAGSYEPAAGVLERILVIDSKQSLVRLELGVIYFRLGSYALAQTYIQEAVEDPALSPEDKAQGQRYLAAIQKRSGLNQYAGSVSGGFRYQSDANLASYDNIFFGGTATGHILFNPRLLKTDQPPRREWNAFMLGQIQDSYDLQTQRDSRIDSTLVGYITRQFGDKSLDVFATEGTIGPSFKPAPITLPNLRVRGYGIVGTSYLGHQRFSTAFGPGVSGAYQFNDRFVLDGSYEFRNEHYDNIGPFAFASALSGGYNLVRVRGGYQISQNQNLVVETLLHSDNVQAAAFSDKALEMNAYYRVQYGSLLPEYAPAPWSINFLAGFKFTRYQGPDHGNDGVLARHDKYVTLGLTNREPFGDSWQAYQQIQYDRNASNIPNDNYDNKTFIAGVTWLF